ncbi:hypothetical protein QZH56_09725 [Streptomyces olivoreticuli]|uniref:hypothetical protein n=1 Tax=Streptomyces olivoreticuli TaxID=68246 RepID=UPI00265B3B3D|nr:hypothetical protein [Streptomyces olivoreticuli]WKK25843.1 hypothetical protein QZH56_09725 [Streptomyces olivoreticuli]
MNRDALGRAPVEHPLSYPGRPATEPTLLSGRTLTPLTPVPGKRLGDWTVATEQQPTLDAVLEEAHTPTTGQRHPVIAVGSNASPAQLHHKLAGRGLPTTTPMVPVRVRGIGVGCSGHIGRNGYVAAAPYAEPDAELTLVISWLDTGQLGAVDATESNYRRVLLPGARFPMTMPSGEALGGAYLYVSLHGVLTDTADGRPLPGGGDQRVLLTRLLTSSPALRDLLGPGPESWVERARADTAVRREGRRIFRRHGWVLTGSGFPAPEETSATPRTYDELSPPHDDTPYPPVT